MKNAARRGSIGFSEKKNGRGGRAGGGGGEKLGGTECQLYIQT